MLKQIDEFGTIGTISLIVSLGTLRLLTLRVPFIHGVLIILLILVLASPIPAFAAKKMQMQVAFNPTQTDLGVSVNISGRISDPLNISVSNAEISIQVNNPQGTSVHIAWVFTNPQGQFQDTFMIRTDSPAGNYTVFLAVDKPGYDTIRNTLIFTYSTPDFSIEPSTSQLSIRQGLIGNLTVTVLALRGFNKAVNLTAIDLPSGVTIQFTPISIVPSGAATASVTVSDLAPVGNYTVTLLAVSGSQSHKATFQLTITPAPIIPPPFQANYTLLGGIGIVIVIVIAAIAFVLRSRARRRRKEAALEELIKQAETDKGYVATARVIARLEELRAMGKVDEATYQHLKKEYEKRLEKST